MKLCSLLSLFVNLLVIILFQFGLVEGIIGGHDAKSSSSRSAVYKYTVSLEKDGKHKGAGCIISDKYVLTSAHLIMSDKGLFLNGKWKVLAGVLKLNGIHKGKKRLDVILAYVPAEFRKAHTNKPNHPETGDIAVLKVSRSFHLSDDSQLVKLKLPPSIDGQYPIYSKKTAIFSGFGADTLEKNKKHQIGKKLKYSKAKVLSKSSCESTWKPSFTDSHLCAKTEQSENKDHSGSCYGDDGGPLVLRGKIVIGILQVHLDDCNENKKSALFTRVSSFKSFIESAIKDQKTEDMRIAKWNHGKVKELTKKKKN